jgi:hypothetical protein
MKTIVNIKNGAYTVDDKLFQDMLQDSKGGRYELELKPLNNRTAKQNAYYWVGVIQPIYLTFKELGNEVEAEDVHEVLKAKFNSKTINIFREGKVAQSTTKLSKEEFSTYIEKIRNWAFEVLGLYIKTSEEYFERFEN